MAETKYKEIEGNVYFTGDTVGMAGKLSELKLVSGPTGTLDGVAWTSGAPALTIGQKYITLSAGSTTYRIPVWANA